VGGVLADIQGGVSLSDALGKHPETFSKVYVSLIRAGEAAGVLETILSRLAESLEKAREFSGKVKGALVYPIIIVFGMIGVMIVMMVSVVPKLSALYSEFDETLPLITRLVIGMSDLMVHFWWLLILILVAGLLGLRAFLAQPSGKKKWDEYVYKLPIIGSMLTQIMFTEISRTLSLLLGAGVSVVEALYIVSETVGNANVEGDLNRIAKQVEKGFPLSVCFSESNYFPPLIGQMIAVGEETGKMDDVLARLSHYYELEADLKVKGLTTALEPIILVIMGLGVGVLIYAIIIPIYQVTNKI
jgi:type II secretory pathway component PulF